MDSILTGCTSSTVWLSSFVVSATTLYILSVSGLSVVSSSWLTINCVVGTVGGLIGLIVGLNVGNDGYCVGLFVGLFVGDGDGLFVGFLDGDGDGLFDGDCDGSSVGDFDGLFVGPSIGDVLGLFDGIFVVGEFDGDAVGSFVGDGVGDGVVDDVGLFGTITNGAGASEPQFAVGAHWKLLVLDVSIDNKPLHAVGVSHVTVHDVDCVPQSNVWFSSSSSHAFDPLQNKLHVVAKSQ